MHPTAGNQIDTRIATQVVSGITGAGLIMREQGHATGLRQGQHCGNRCSRVSLGIWDVHS